MTTKCKPRFEIRCLEPAIGYLAVWTYDVGGQVVMTTTPLDFVGAADRQVHSKGLWVSDGPEIVSVQLSGGDFEVADGCENFHGVVREGATWEECLALLPSDLEALVVKPIAVA